MTRAPPRNPIAHGARYVTLRFCMFGRFTFLALFTLSALPLGGCAVESAPAAEPPAEVRAEARESARDIYLAPLTRTVSGRVRQGATLATLFARHELDDEAHPLIETIRGVFDPRRLRVDNPYHLVVGLEDGALRQFEYHVDDDEFLQVNRTAAGFDAALVPYRQASIEQVLEADIDARNNSIVAAIGAQDEGVMLAVALAEVLSGEIDFNNDLRRGARFSLLYEEIYREERFDDDSGDDL